MEASFLSLLLAMVWRTSERASLIGSIRASSCGLNVVVDAGALLPVATGWVREDGPIFIR